MLPRLTFKSQDVTEGKGKSKKVVVEAGTFFIERQTEEIDEATGKPAWSSEEQGDEVEGIILYQRKQLKFFDEATDSFVNSPIYDSPDEIIPLFQNGAEIARGTAAELRARKEFADTNKAGKPISKLEETRVLYVLMGEGDDAEVFQLNIRGTSMYSFLTYARKTNVPAVLTKFTSEAQENGAIEWNKMMFEAVRQLSDKEVDVVLKHQGDLKDAIAQQKAYFASQDGKALPAGERDPLEDEFEEEEEK
jgi:hypothetical protein